MVVSPGIILAKDAPFDTSHDRRNVMAGLVPAIPLRKAMRS
jgi:hypothetical protein